MKRDFKVYERNTYSLATQVKQNAIATYNQYANLQTFVFYHEITVQSYLYRADMCDLLAKLNQMKMAGELPRRSNSEKGRGYLSTTGIMALLSNKGVPHTSSMHVTLDSASLSMPDSTLCKTINATLSKSYRENTALPNEAVTKETTEFESIVSFALETVRTHKCTFDLNRDMATLNASKSRLIKAIEDNICKARSNASKGESYITEDMIVTFRLYNEHSHTCETSTNATPSETLLDAFVRECGIELASESNDEKQEKEVIKKELEKTEEVPVITQKKQRSKKVTQEKVEKETKKEVEKEVKKETKKETKKKTEEISTVAPQTDACRIIYIVEGDLCDNDKKRMVWYGDASDYRYVKIGVKTALSKALHLIAAVVKDGILMVDENDLKVKCKLPLEQVDYTSEAYLAFKAALGI